MIHRTFWECPSEILKKSGWKLKKIIVLLILKMKVYTIHWQKQGYFSQIKLFVSYVILNVVLRLTTIMKVKLCDVYSTKRLKYCWTKMKFTWKIKIITFLWLPSALTVFLIMHTQQMFSVISHSTSDLFIQH